MNEEIETSEWKKNGCEKGARATTGCSLSDQHILSPKYNDLFLSDFRRFTEVFNFRTISANLCKSDKISRHILG